jgi:hypothetical protein
MITECILPRLVVGSQILGPGAGGVSVELASGKSILAIVASIQLGIKHEKNLACDIATQKRAHAFAGLQQGRL